MTAVSIDGGAAWPRFRRRVRRVVERLGLLGPFHRAAERRLARTAGPWAAVVDGLPTPPPLLVAQVAGHADLDSFLQQGRSIAALIGELAGRHGSPLERPGTVLDFGCGCGRLARHLAPKVLGAGGRFLGVDVNRGLIDWSARAMPGEYRLNRMRAPAPVADATVRLLYAVSVFTHLPRSRMIEWLADYARVLEPGGVALVSFADEDCAPAEFRPVLARDGFVVSTRSLEGSNYMASFAAAEAFAALCAAHLDVLEIVPGGRSGETLAWAVLRRAPG
jgi:SAM-dependent methyltransferase